MKKRKAWNIAVIAAAVFFLVSGFLGKALGLISFKLGWIEYLVIFVVVLSAVLSWLELKGKFSSRNLKLAQHFYDSGNAYYKNADLNSAISNYKMALHMDPDFPPAHNALGRAFYLKGNLKQSIQYFKRAIELEPDNAGAKEVLDLVIQASSEKILVGDVYSDERYGFSIKCPQECRISNRHEPGILIRFLDNNKKCSINIIAGPTHGVLESIKDLENTALRVIHMNKFQLISLKRIRVDNIEAVEIVYNSQKYLKSKKVGFVKNGVEFIITCGVRADHFEEYEPILDECIQSFRFKK